MILQSHERYTVVVCALREPFRKGFISRLDACDFCILEARKLSTVAYVYDKTLSATVYRVDCREKVGSQYV